LDLDLGFILNPCSISLLPLRHHGLIYQVVWVRVFRQRLRHTIYSASASGRGVQAGLGAGSYLAGPRSDRRYAANPSCRCGAYGYFELTIRRDGPPSSRASCRLSIIVVLVTAYQQDARLVRHPTGSYAALTRIALVYAHADTLLMAGRWTL